MSNDPMATVVTKPCPFCNKPGDVLRLQSMADYNAWVGGTVIQNAMPYLNADERERLMTGICPECWDETFSEEWDD